MLLSSSNPLWRGLHLRAGPSTESPQVSGQTPPEQLEQLRPLSIPDPKRVEIGRLSQLSPWDDELQGSDPWSGAQRYVPLRGELIHALDEIAARLCDLEECHSPGSPEMRTLREDRVNAEMRLGSVERTIGKLRWEWLNAGSADPVTLHMPRHESFPQLSVPANLAASKTRSQSGPNLASRVVAPPPLVIPDSST